MKDGPVGANSASAASLGLATVVMMIGLGERIGSLSMFDDDECETVSRCGRARSAAIDALGDAQIAQLAAQIDRDDVLAAIAEGVLRVVIAVANLVQRIADAVAIAEADLLTRLEPKRARLLDLALSLAAGGERRGRNRRERDGGRDQYGNDRVTHGNTFVEADTEQLGLSLARS